jgi:hypothetical protein
MSRARAPSGPTISLFPFLAVLLCTMGALLVLLVLFSRSAQRSDTAAADAARQEAERQSRDELEAARDELAWRIDQMREVRDRTAAELAKARMQLAGTEEDARRLADDLDALGRTAEALEDTSADDAGAEAIVELERRLAEAQKALDEAHDATASKPPAYAVVPFEGPTGTHRRPLYIECCIDGVFLQPEGIRLGPADFEGPPGPGNPLASALRAAREHIARSPGESGDPNVQPYPLLLVRPSGVMAYYAARESIQSWGSEFGYQFIDEEWTLTYPPRDAALAEAEMRAVEEARRRLEWLAQVRPVKKQAKPATQYRAATTRGGVVSSSGPSVLGDQSRFDWTEQQAGGAGGPGRGFTAGGSGAGGDGDSLGGGDVILGQRGGGTAAGPGGQGMPASGGSSGGNGTAGGGDFAAVGSRYSGPSKFYASSGTGAGPGGPAGSTGAGTQPGGTSESGSETGGSPAGSSAADGGQTAANGSGSNGSPSGENTPGGSGSGRDGGGASGGGGGAAGMAGSASGATGGGGSGPSMPGLHQPGGASAGGMSGESSGSVGASLAGRRGSNWASLATNDNPVPLTRPIKLECSADEFRILGDGGRVQSRIPIGTHTVDSVDPLVREVHATVGGWGLAGDRMYWKPELVLSATPDGVGRRDDLEKLLADSGMDTRRSENREKVRNLPPVQRTGSLFPRR